MKRVEDFKNTKGQKKKYAYNIEDYIQIFSLEILTEQITWNNQG